MIQKKNPVKKNNTGEHLHQKSNKNTELANTVPDNEIEKKFKLKTIKGQEWYSERPRKTKDFC